MIKTEAQECDMHLAARKHACMWDRCVHGRR